MYADKRSNVTANVFIAASPEEIKIKYDVLEKDVDFTDMVAKVGGLFWCIGSRTWAGNLDALGIKDPLHSG